MAGRRASWEKVKEGSQGSLDAVLDEDLEEPSGLSPTAAFRESSWEKAQRAKRASMGIAKRISNTLKGRTGDISTATFLSRPHSTSESLRWQQTIDAQDPSETGL